MQKKNNQVYIDFPIRYYKNVVEEKETIINSSYIVGDKTVKEIKHNIFNIDYKKVEEDSKPIKEEVKEFMNKMPLFTKGELYYILDELLKEYTISPVEKMEKVKKLSYNDICNIRFD